MEKLKNKKIRKVKKMLNSEIFKIKGNEFNVLFFI